MENKHDAGFSLIEVLIAIVILAAIVVPTCSSLVISHRMNAKTERLMQAQLDVSSAVETLMAEGIKAEDVTNITYTKENGTTKYESAEGIIIDARFSNVKISVKEYRTQPACYSVTCVGKDDNTVEVRTVIQAKGDTIIAVKEAEDERGAGS